MDLGSIFKNAAHAVMSAVMVCCMYVCMPNIRTYMLWRFIIRNNIRVRMYRVQHSVSNNVHNYVELVYYVRKCSGVFF